MSRNSENILTKHLHFKNAQLGVSSHQSFESLLILPGKGVRHGYLLRYDPSSL